MSQDIIDLYMQVLPGRRINTGSGWLAFQCPACRDNHWPGRGGFLVTETGGFRYSCFNAGCDYQTDPTGWEPGDGLGGRPRRLYEMLGGDIIDIPLKYLMMPAGKYDQKGQKIGEDQLEAVYSYPAIDLPPGTILLDEAKGKDPEDVRKYLINRGEFFLTAHPFCWTPMHPRHLIIPCTHYKEIVGWTARAIDPKGKDKRYFRSSPWPKEYMFNQDKINDRSSRRLIVQEGELDAIVLNSLACFGARPSLKQINLLKNTGKDIVMLPDFVKGEYDGFLEVAEQNRFWMSTPGWAVDGDSRIKDVGESVKLNGRLMTIELVIAGITRDYDTARVSLAINAKTKR